MVHIKEFIFGVIVGIVANFGFNLIIWFINHVRIIVI